MPQPNKIQGYEIPSQALENWRYSGMTDPAVVGTDESAGPSQPSERDSPVEVQKYPVYWPYWTEKSVPIPAPDKSGGQDQASPPSPPIPPATEQIPGTASPGPANQFVTERQDHKGEEDPAKPDSDWLRRELEMLFQLRAKGRSFEEISQDLSKSEHGNSARRDAKACEGKWTHFTYETNRNKIK